MNESTSVAPLDGAAIEADFQRAAAQYRERYGIKLTREEAVEAYKLVAPLCNSSPDRDEAERWCAGFGCVWADPVTGAKSLIEENVCAILTAFEGEHAGEAVPADSPLKDPWARYFALLALQLLAREELVSYPPLPIRELIARAVPILERERPLKRPRGRNPAIQKRRDRTIGWYLEALAGCGLPVTPSKGPSLSGALAKALDQAESTIAKVWEQHPWRDKAGNAALPPELRMSESLTRRRPRTPRKRRWTCLAPRTGNAPSAARPGRCPCNGWRRSGSARVAWTATLCPHDRSEPIGAHYCLPFYFVSALLRGWIPSVSRLWKTEEFNSGEPNTANGGSRGANLPEQEHDLRADRQRAFPEVCSLERACARLSRTRDRRLDRGARDEPRGGALRATGRAGSPSPIPRGGGVNCVERVAPGRTGSGPGA